MKSYAINPGRLWAFEIKQDELKDHRFLIEHAEGKHTFINYDVQSEILSIAVCAPEFDPRFAEALLIECGNFHREVEQGDHIIVLHTSVGGAELAKAVCARCEELGRPFSCQSVDNLVHLWFSETGQAHLDDAIPPGAFHTPSDHDPSQGIASVDISGTGEDLVRRQINAWQLAKNQEIDIDRATDPDLEALMADTDLPRPSSAEPIVTTTTTTTTSTSTAPKAEESTGKTAPTDVAKPDPNRNTRKSLRLRDIQAKSVMVQPLVNYAIPVWSNALVDMSKGRKVRCRLKADEAAIAFFYEPTSTLSILVVGHQVDTANAQRQVNLCLGGLKLTVQKLQKLDHHQIGYQIISDPASTAAAALKAMRKPRVGGWARVRARSAPITSSTSTPPSPSTWPARKSRLARVARPGTTSRN